MSINIHGKEYMTVNERLKIFRSDFKQLSLITEIVEIDKESILMKASIIDADGLILAIGHAYEEKASSNINKTSHVENCETSAWGRALGNLGIGIDEAVATADEVVNAIANQNKPSNCPHAEFDIKEGVSSKSGRPYQKLTCKACGMISFDKGDSWMVSNG